MYVNIFSYDYCLKMMYLQMIIGDGIVWWRACVIWPGNLAIRSLCILMLLATLGGLII